jgi:DNA-binding GntR family transcriptional regulator
MSDMRTARSVAALRPDGARPTIRLERVSTSEALVNALTKQILDGSIEAGSWLREVDLAERHGVSRQSLRAALVELVHLGLLQREPNRGVYVPVMTEEDIRDLYHVRSLIEIEAARTVALHPEAWPAMEAVVARLERLPSDAGSYEMVEEDFAFHRAMVAGVGSPRLARAHETLCSEIRLSFVANIREDGQDYLVGEHRDLLDVIRRGDPEAAEARIVTHLDAGLAASLQRIVAIRH